MSAERTGNISMRLIAGSILLSLGSAVVALPQVLQQRAAAIESLANAERAFARTSAEKGIQPSFLEFFAPDGINFQPHPVNTREALRQRTAPATKPPITLNWTPVTADVSAAGDLGYTTGPFLLTDDKDGAIRSQGYYFSIWKKQPDGSWRVAVDFGIDTPKFEDRPLSRPFHPARSRITRAEKVPSPDNERGALIQRDRAFVAAASKDGLVKAYRSYTSLQEETRLLRAKEFPFTDALAIEKRVAGELPLAKWEPLAAAVAASGEMGYTYGSWEANRGGQAEKGYYVRVWKRGPRGWIIVAEVMNPLPPESN